MNERMSFLKTGIFKKTVSLAIAAIMVFGIMAFTAMAFTDEYGECDEAFAEKYAVGVKDPWAIRKNYGSGFSIPMNGKWGNEEDLGALVPGWALTIFYDPGPYDLATVQHWVRIVAVSTGILNPVFGGDWGPDFQIPISDWDPDNGYFQMTYDDLFNHFEKFEPGWGTDFSKASIGDMQFVIIIGWEEAKDEIEDPDLRAIGPDDMFIIGARLGEEIKRGGSAVVEPDPTAAPPVATTAPSGGGSGSANTGSFEMLIVMAGIALIGSTVFVVRKVKKAA